MGLLPEARVLLRDWKYGVAYSIGIGRGNFKEELMQML